MLEQKTFIKNANKDADKVILLQKSLIAMEAIRDILKEKSEKAEKIVLDLVVFNNKEGVRVTEPTLDYSIADEQIDLYYKMRNIALDEMKIKHPKADEGYCSYCTADYNVIKQKRKIFDLVMTWLPKEMSEILSYNPCKSMDLVIKMFMSIKKKDLE